MKKYTLRRIVLASIGLLSSVLLLIGLSFDILAVDLSELGDIGGSVTAALKMDVNGFDMLSFSIPKLLRTACLNYIKKDVCVLFETIFGISSWLTLLVSIVAAVCIVMAFFGKPKKQNENLFLGMIVAALVCALLQTILSVLLTCIIQSKLEEYYETLKDTTAEYYRDLVKFSTKAFISVILQAACLIAYVVCLNKVKDGEKGKVQTAQGRISTCEEEIVQTIGMEIKVANLLKEYKDLCDAQIISAADYTNKKVYLLRYSEKKIKRGIADLRGNCLLETAVRIEENAVAAIKAYTQLLHTGVISDADFFEIKAALLSCAVEE